MQVSVVVTIQVTPGEEIPVARALAQFERRASMEGALRYDVVPKDSRFLVIEVWPDRSTLKDHLTSIPFQERLEEVIIPRLDKNVGKALDLQIHEGAQLTLEDITA